MEKTVQILCMNDVTGFMTETIKEIMKFKEIIKVIVDMARNVGNEGIYEIWILEKSKRQQTPHQRS